MPVALIGAGIAAAGAVGSAVIGSHAQSKAAQTAADTARDTTAENNALQRDIYGQNKQVLQPFYQSGYGATSMINALLGIPQGQQQTQQAPANDPGQGYGAALQGNGATTTPFRQFGPNGVSYDSYDPAGAPGQNVTGGPMAPQQGGTVNATGTAPLDYNQAFSNYRNSTGYQFRLGEGERALNSGWAARGLLNSGAAQKAALKFGQDYGSNEFGNYLGYLGNQQGVGLTAAGALAGVGTNYANNVSNQNNALASVLANSALARGQSSANMWGTAAGALGQIGGGLISSYSGPKAPTFNDNIVRYVS